MGASLAHQTLPVDRVSDPTTIKRQLRPASFSEQTGAPNWLSATQALPRALQKTSSSSHTRPDD